MLSLSYILEYTLLSMALKMHSKTISYYDYVYQIPFIWEGRYMGRQNEAKIFSLTDTHSSKPQPFLYPEIGREADILKLMGINIKT